MISDVKNYPVSSLFDIEQKLIYVIPRYQREYTWNKSNWEALFDDIVECNDTYFLGSIICVNQSKDSLDVQKLELVDGQQRLTTLSILLLALYSNLSEMRDKMDDDQVVELTNLKHRIILKKTDYIRINPQFQNSNNEDYRFLLSEEGIITKVKKPRNAGNRRIQKCFKYLKQRLLDFVADEVSPLESLLECASSFLKTTLVKIEVASHSDAYTLFESLNNRGVPLSPIDIIKNKLLAEIEKINPSIVEASFDRWQELLKDLGDDYNIQERFFRQFYNGFKNDLKGIIDVPVATKSNLIQIFEKLIQENPETFLDRILKCGEYMALILRNSEDDDLALEYKDCIEWFSKLERIQAAPSYLLLLHLLYYKKDYHLTSAHFRFILKQLVSFFVRRSITDFPPTYELSRLFMSMVEKICNMPSDTRNGTLIVNFICAQLKKSSAEDTLFEKRLRGPIYEENKWATRFILCSIEEGQMNREGKKDLWLQDKNNYVWTIEHIFPQGKNIPESWVQMMADGDMQKAMTIQEEHVHELGNLTISGFNSSLGNKSFEDKRDRTKEGKFVGYKNGLFLNEDLAIETTWTAERITSRTTTLVDKVIALFGMEDTFS
jgi:uncharacterized protein with ParB-like and HNH nuclease domain